MIDLPNVIYDYCKQIEKNYANTRLLSFAHDGTNVNFFAIREHSGISTQRDWITIGLYPYFTKWENNVEVNRIFLEICMVYYVGEKSPKILERVEAEVMYYSVTTNQLFSIPDISNFKKDMQLMDDVVPLIFEEYDLNYIINYGIRGVKNVTD